MNIEKGVPIPKARGSGRNLVTLNAMEVGDSIVIPADQGASWRNSAIGLGIKIVTRKVSDSERRVWRVG